MNDIVGSLTEAIDNIIKSNNTFNDVLKIENGTVIYYDQDSNKALVNFVASENEYLLYNKSGEVLSEGDSVKVYYNSNPAKGWIGMRLGEPVIVDLSQPIRKIIVQDKTYDDKIEWTNNGVEFCREVYIPQTMPNILDVGNVSLNLHPNYSIGYDMSDGTTFFFAGYLSDGTLANVSLTAKELPKFSQSGEYISSTWTIYTNGEKSFEYTSETRGNGGTWYFGYQNILLINDDYCAPLYSLHIETDVGTSVFNNYSGFNGVCANIIGWESQLSAIRSRDKITYKKPQHFFGNSFVIKLKQYKGVVSIPRLTSLPDDQQILYDWGDGSNPEIFDSSTMESYANHEYKKEGFYIISIQAEMNGARLGVWNDINVADDLNAKNNVKMMKFPAFLKKIDLGTFIEGAKMLDTVWLSDTAQYVNISFKNCTNLKVCNLPSGIITFGELSSFRNTGLTTVTLPKTLSDMPDYLYADCSKLKDVTFSCSLGKYIFSDCKNLTSVKFKNVSGATVSIGEGAFFNCQSLTSISLPTYIAKIEHKAFLGTSLKKVSLASNTEYYSDSFPPNCIVSGGTLI